MNDFMNFKNMVTPSLVKMLFWIGLVVCILIGLIRIFSGEFIAGVLALLVGPLLVRVYCELLIVIFTINDSLSDVRDLLRNRPATAPSSD